MEQQVCKWQTTSDIYNLFYLFEMKSNGGRVGSCLPTKIMQQRQKTATVSAVVIDDQSQTQQNLNKVGQQLKFF